MWEGTTFGWSITRFFHRFQHLAVHCGKNWCNITWPPLLKTFKTNDRRCELGVQPDWYLCLIPSLHHLVIIKCFLVREEPELWLDQTVFDFIVHYTSDFEPRHLSYAVITYITTSDCGKCFFALVKDDITQYLLMFPLRCWPCTVSARILSIIRLFPNWYYWCRLSREHVAMAFLVSD